jgi:hypothetical protein
MLRKDVPGVPCAREPTARGDDVSNPAKRKGSNAERELAKLFADCGLDEAHRQPLSGAVPDFPGDVNLNGYLVECKRTERLDLWAAIRQAAAAARGGRVPIVCFRRSRSPWYTVIETTEFAAMERELREWRGRFAGTTFSEEANPAVCRRCGKPFSSKGLSGSAFFNSRHTHFPNCPTEAAA